MTEKVKLIVLKRDLEAHRDGSIPGTLYVGDHKFPTIERGGGYVNLKVGDYVMEHSVKNTGRPVKCLRPIEKEVDTLLIHDAFKDSSLQLQGCVAPGMAKKPPPGVGILRSAKAMELLWTLLGGWEKGKQVTLHVLNNVPGETRTKMDWNRTRNPRLRRLLRSRAPRHKAPGHG